MINKYFKLSLLLFLFIFQFILAQLPEFDDKYSSIEDGKYMPIEWYQNHCLEYLRADTSLTCKVLSFDKLSLMNEKDFYYALFQLSDSSSFLWKDRYANLTTGITIFKNNNDSLIKPVWDYWNMDQLEMTSPPFITTTNFGNILCIPIYLFGTHGWHKNIYFIYKRNQWKRLDSESWWETLYSSIPEGHTINAGIEIDLTDFIGGSLLWKKDDCHACQSGGAVNFEFEIEDFRFIIKNIAYIPQDSIDVH